MNDPFNPQAPGVVPTYTPFRIITGYTPGRIDGTPLDYPVAANDRFEPEWEPLPFDNDDTPPGWVGAVFLFAVAVLSCGGWFAIKAVL